LFAEAGNRLVAARFEAIQRCTTIAEPGIEHSARSLLDSEIGITEFPCRGGSEVHTGYRQEVIDLMRIRWDEKQKRRFSDCPISLHFSFLLTHISRQAMDLARNCLPLPSYATLYTHFGTRLHDVESNLTDMSKVDLQMAESIAANDCSLEPLISLSIDAMVITSDEHYLPAQDGDQTFVFYIQPLDRRLKCKRLHVMNLPSGQTTKQVQAVIETVCDALSRHGVNIKYVCADGDPGYNQRHSHFFLEWYSILIESGLAAVLGFLSEAKMIPASDYLRL
jgi:hypothetical protein